MTEKVYTTFQIAKICGVQPGTIISWIKSKKIKGYVTPGGHRRVTEACLLEFLKKYEFPIPKAMKTKRKILIVEDDPEVGKMLQRTLSQNLDGACQVEWVMDSSEALLLLARDPVDLILLDVVMPGRDGEQVLTAIKSKPHFKKYRVIGMTGHRLPAIKIKFMRDHADAFFYKPFDVQKLTRKVTQLLGL